MLIHWYTNLILIHWYTNLILIHWYTNLVLIHWCTLQNVSNIDSRAFSMNSDLQATRKKSLSNTCWGV